jgi:hypothetical protein
LISAVVRSVATVNKLWPDVALQWTQALTAKWRRSQVKSRPVGYFSYETDTVTWPDWKGGKSMRCKVEDFIFSIVEPGGVLLLSSCRVI